jgi:very-short-patch-repair endonuclease
MEPMRDTYPPLYDPPYESPIEDLFAYHAVKYLRAGAELHKQFTVSTIGGVFRLDFLLTAPDCEPICVECDGAEFHKDMFRDARRDALVIDAGACRVVYRITGRAVNAYIADSLYLMSLRDPEYFSDRGRTNLHTLASDTLREYVRRFGPWNSETIELRYPRDIEEGWGVELVRRAWKSETPRGIARFLRVAHAQGPMDIDGLMQIELAETKRWASDVPDAAEDL